MVKMQKPDKPPGTRTPRSSRRKFSRLAEENGDGDPKERLSL